MTAERRDPDGPRHWTRSQSSPNEKAGEAITS